MLREAAKDVCSEMRMLRRSWDNHRDDASAWTGWFIHTRNLMRFFHGVEDKHTDVLARHYFCPPGDWDFIREQCGKPPDFDQYEQACHTLAAHLSYRRTEYRTGIGVPPSEAIQAHLVVLATAFLFKLPPERQPWFWAD